MEFLIHSSLPSYYFVTVAVLMGSGALNIANIQWATLLARIKAVGGGYLVEQDTYTHLFDIDFD